MKYKISYTVSHEIDLNEKQPTQDEIEDYIKEWVIDVDCLDLICDCDVTRGSTQIKNVKLSEVK